MSDPILSALLSATIIAVLAFLIHRHSSKNAAEKLQELLSATNEAERKTHLREMEFLAEKNKLEISHADAIKQARSITFEEGRKHGNEEHKFDTSRQLADSIKEARSISFEEGRKHGNAEHELDTSKRLAEQRNEFIIRLQQEKEISAKEARDKQRAEQELQTKIFSVKISPYVQLLTDNGIFKDTHEARIGYQYQLLVNGIPAFQPHVLIERHEKIQKVDESVKKTLLSIAQNCAEAAITTYLGASPQFAKLAPSVLEQIEKK